jgi:hypothetical protein
MFNVIGIVVPNIVLYDEFSFLIWVFILLLICNYFAYKL